MKLSAPCILVFAVLMFFVSCASHASKTVFVIEGTEIYHSPDCSRLVMAKTQKMTLEEAHAKNLVPCPYCKPDRER